MARVEGRNTRFIGLNVAATEAARDERVFTRLGDHVHTWVMGRTVAIPLGINHMRDDLGYVFSIPTLNDGDSLVVKGEKRPARSNPLDDVIEQAKKRGEKVYPAAHVTEFGYTTPPAAPASSPYHTPPYSAPIPGYAPTKAKVFPIPPSKSPTHASLGFNLESHEPMHTVPFESKNRPDKVFTVRCGSSGALGCTCGEYMKRGVCSHIEATIKEGWDVFYPGAGTDRLTLEGLVNVVLFTRKPVLTVNVAVDEPGEGNAQEVMWAGSLLGYLMPGEGRSVLRDFLIAHLASRYREMFETDCGSTVHVEGPKVRFDAMSKQGLYETLTKLTAGQCVRCFEIGSVTPDIDPI